MRDDTGKVLEVYYLHNDSTGEIMEFDSRAEWEAERRAKNARPPLLEVDEVSGITGFDTDGRFVIGNYDSGYFILDIAENSLDTFESEDEWTQAVAQRTGMSTTGLRDPKSWFIQSRHPVVLAIVGGLALIALPWVTAPLWRKNR
jgi:hypothetical protein